MKSVFSNSYYRLKSKYKHRFHRRCAVLIYHRIVNLEIDTQLLAVAPSNFDSHLHHLKQHYNVLSIDELKDILIKNKKLPVKSIAVTFDDGYADNYINALPILEKHKVQALFYICTGNLNSEREFWWDELERIFLLSENLPDNCVFTLSGKENKFSTSTPLEIKETYDLIHTLLKPLNPKERTRIISELAFWSKNLKPRESHRSMTFDEIKKMGETPFAVIGAHTHNHPSLSSLTQNEQYDEIKESKDILEKVLARNVDHFSFPFGNKNDYNVNSIEICQSLGFEMVFANYPSLITKGYDLFQLPRFLVRNWNEKMFASNVRQFFN